MITASISDLKVNPASIIAQSLDYPVAVKSHNKVQAYVVGKDLYEKLLSSLEDKLDKAAILDTDFSKGTAFEDLARELGI